MFCSSFQLHFFVACNFAFWSKVGCSAKYSVRFQLPVGGRGLARPRSAADAAVMPPQQRRTLRVIPPHVCGALHDWCSTCTQASTGHCGIDAQLAQARAEPHIHFSSISASSTVRAARCSSLMQAIGTVVPGAQGASCRSVADVSSALWCMAAPQLCCPVQPGDCREWQRARRHMLERLPRAQGVDTDRPGALMATGRAMLRLEGSLQRMKGGNFFKEAVPKGAKRARRLAVSVFSIRSVRLYAMSFDHNSSTLRAGLIGDDIVLSRFHRNRKH